MTYLDVVFNYGALPGENELRAIDTMRDVYGIRSVQFDHTQRTVRCLWSNCTDRIPYTSRMVSIARNSFSPGKAP